MQSLFLSLLVELLLVSAILCKEIPQFANRVKRVIGGNAIAEGDWPWLVRLKGEVPHKMKRIWFFSIPYDYHDYYCGASILNDRWLLTAAHCFDQNHYVQRTRVPKYWHAKIGEVDRTTTILDWISGNRDLHLEEIRIHPQYNPDRLWQNDIAVVKTRRSMGIGTQTTDKVSLWGLDDGPAEIWEAADTECYFKGWGCAANGAPLEEYAQEVMLPIIDDESCRQTYGISTETRLCAGYEDGNAGICPGDSGGPLVCPKPGTDGTSLADYWQAGVASFTAANDPGSYPGAFTRVTHYTQWILDNIS